MILPTETPKTQKAKGLKALAEYCLGQTPKFNIYDAQKFKQEDDLLHLLNLFVRPCPMRPRHGFVDSRVVTTHEQAKALVDETLAADPEAELIAMSFIDAPFSGIWTDGSLAIGKGHDGATAGTSAITIPTIGHVFGDIGDTWWGTENLYSKAGVTNAPYLELLWHKESWDKKDELTAKFVQLRDGPSIPASVDYIPEETEVSEVIPAIGDLLEWESKMKDVKPGTVVYHPNGSLASHYSIHAILHKIPVIISRIPYVGEVLKPCVESSEPNLKAIRAGFYIGCTRDMQYRTAAKIMLTGCHHIAVWRGKYDLLLGFALGAAYRLTVAAVLGEMRHKPDKRYTDYDNRNKGDRNEVYHSAWNNILSIPIRTKFQKALISFLTDSWPSSFGGASWFRFTHWAALVYNAVLEGNVDSALQSFNQLVNSAHNTGWGFDKFIPKEYMDRAAANPAGMLLQTAPIMYEVVESNSQKIAELAHEFKFHRRRLTLPDYEIRPNGSVVWISPAMKALKATAEEKAQFKIYTLSGYAHIQYHKGLNHLYEGIDILVSQEQLDDLKAKTIGLATEVSMYDAKYDPMYIKLTKVSDGIFAFQNYQFNLKDKTCQMTS